REHGHARLHRHRASSRRVVPGVPSGASGFAGRDREDSAASARPPRGHRRGVRLPRLGRGVVRHRGFDPRDGGTGHRLTLWHDWATHPPWEVTMSRSIIRLGIVFLTCLGLFCEARPVEAAPEGTVTWGVHITLASRWLDPAETEGIITPFMFLYALHDALVKPMPAGWNTPSLAESWTQSKDGLVYEFVLRKGSSST